MTQRVRGRPGDDSAEVEAFLRRRLPADVHPRARLPGTPTAPTASQARRNVVIAYRRTDFAIYRTVVDRLAPGERFALNTAHGIFEMSAHDIENDLADIAATPSYREGTDSQPHACHYVRSGEPPVEAIPFLVPRDRPARA